MDLQDCLNKRLRFSLSFVSFKKKTLSLLKLNRLDPYYSSKTLFSAYQSTKEI